jgi:hypothetical protein
LCVGMPGGAHLRLICRGRFQYRSTVGAPNSSNFPFGPIIL